MKKSLNLLVLNPGSTSTKVAIYENGKEKYYTSIKYSLDQVSKYKRSTDQAGFRKEDILKYIKEIGYDMSRIDAVVSRCGCLPPMKMGAYEINQRMVDCVLERPTAQHPCSTGVIISKEIADEYGIKAYTYDTDSGDEMSDLARLSGMPEIPRESMGHILNHRRVARKFCENNNIDYKKKNIITCHMGGGVSIMMHEQGRSVDVVTDEDGPYSAERAAGVPCCFLASMCFSGKYTKEEVLYKLRGGGGFVAYLGTNSGIEVEKRIAAGDEKARLVYEGMAYQVAKFIGELATVVKGKVDAIVITGGMANSKMLTGWITDRVSFIQDVTLMPGEYEMIALAEGIGRALNGEEEIHEFVE